MVTGWCRVCFPTQERFWCRDFNSLCLLERDFSQPSGVNTPQTHFTTSVVPRYLRRKCFLNVPQNEANQTVIESLRFEDPGSLRSLSDTDNALILKPTICSWNWLAAIHFKFALTPWISALSLNNRDQTTSRSHFGFWELDEDRTWSSRRPQSFAAFEETSRSADVKNKISLDVATSTPVNHPDLGSFWFASPGSRGVAPHLLWSHKWSRNDQSIIVAAISMSDCVMMSAGLR